MHSAKNTDPADRVSVTNELRAVYRARTAASAEGAFTLAYCDPPGPGIGEDLKCDVRSIKEVVIFDEEEITEKVPQNAVATTTCRIDELQKQYKRASQLAGRL